MLNTLSALSLQATDNGILKSDAAYPPVNDTVTVLEFFFALLPAFLVEPYVDSNTRFTVEEEVTVKFQTSGS